MFLIGDANRSIRVILKLVSDTVENSVQAAAALLGWYHNMGADEVLADEAIDRFAESAALSKLQEANKPAAAANYNKPAQKLPSGKRALNTAAIRQFAEPPATQAPRQPAPAASLAQAEIEALAQSCTSLNELAHTLDSFDACPLKRTASKLCFADGLPGAHVMVIGEVPGREEDEQGRPFAGKSGQLLDQMLSCIGLNRESDDPSSSVFISNVVFWRPPGNRKPSPAEMKMCLPFLKRAIELAGPRVVVAAGAMAAEVLLDTKTSMTRLRGNWKTIVIGKAELPLLLMLHPSDLLRRPETKKDAWADLLSLKQKLTDGI